MKTLLAIALVLLVYAAGFCNAAAPHVPMAPGVTSPGVKNPENVDVPHMGDDMVMVAVDNDGSIYYVDTSSLKDDGNGIKSIVVLIENPADNPKHPNVHRLAGRSQFKCAEKQNMSGIGYLLNDVGDIVGSLPAEDDWTPIRAGTIAAAAAVVVCAKRKMPSDSVEL